MLRNHRTTLLHLALLFLAVLMVYWPIAFFQYSLKWDTADGYLPLRYFLSECLRNGEWPLWQPYTSCGYPFHGDPQSAAWYLPAWLLSIAFGYNMFTMELEFTLTLFMAAVGMYLLSRSIIGNARVALCVAIAYMGCGFFVGNAQHFTWLISGACIPFILFAYYKMQQEQRYGYALLTAFFLWLLVTGGYPAFLLVTAYVLFAFFLVKTSSDFSNKNYKAIYKQLILNSVLTLSFLCLSAAMVLSIAQVQPVISRGLGISLETALQDSFSLKSCISLLLPFAALKGHEPFGADVSMNNAYFGLLCFVLLLVNVFTKKSKTEYLLWGIAVLFFFIALGSLTPLRALLYNYLPGMNLFRFPALFRLFFIIPCLLLAGIQHERVLHATSSRKTLLRVCIALVVFIIGIISIAILKNKQALQLGTLFINYENTIEHASISRQIIIQGCLQLVLLLILITVLHYKQKLYHGFFVCFLLVDIGITTYLNRFTIVLDYPTKEVAAKFKEFPKEFPLPKGIIAYNTDWGKGYLWPIQHNTGFYYKVPSRDGYNSFRLSSYEKLRTRPTFQEEALHHPLLYFADSLKALKDTLSGFTVGLRSVFLEDSVYARWKDLPLAHSATDTIIYQEFRPNLIKACVITAKPQLLVLLQNSMKEWQVQIDQQSSIWHKANTSFMATFLPAGKHEVVWEYKPSTVYIGMALSGAALLAILIAFTFFRRTLF